MGKQKKKPSLQKRRKRRLLRAYLIFLLILLLTVGIGIGALVLEQFIPFRTADIVIDPGHGDHDPGAVAIDIYEKDITLDIALKTEKLLKDAGYKVRLTRDDDSFLELGERAEFANKRNAKVFVSIHCNSSEDGSGQGIETYYGESKTDADHTLAEKIQECLIIQTGARDREIKEAAYTVLVRTEMPSALVETGFMTNDAERAQLMDEHYQELIALGISEGIMGFLEENK